MAPLGFAPLLFLSSSRFRVYIFVLLTASAFVVAVSTFLSVSGYQEESLELFSALGRVFLVAAVLLVAEVFWLVKHSENVPP
ncbi:hypothetical protein KAI87_05830, partial [Myxococcota bacterium]|nr:hypothetical protein [Myxococcota bacterium]